MKNILIIQNDKAEGAGIFLGLLDQIGFHYDTVFGDTINEAKIANDNLYDYHALIILGGAQGVYEQDLYPYLTNEIALCQSYIGDNKAVFGICLGAQILATALGGKVKKNSQKELGWHSLELTEEGLSDLLFENHPSVSPGYHFHGDYFDLPPRCVNLASSVLTACQAFRYGTKVYGFQYHCEVDLPLVETMCRGNADYMKSHGSEAEQVIRESAVLLEDYEQQCLPIMQGWLSMVEKA